MARRPELMTTSGDKAVADAAARAASTREVNLESLPPLPEGVPADTANVRLGPEISPTLLAVFPLVGVWRGFGRFGNEPGERTPQFGQQITFAHDGRGFLRYESVTWLLDTDGSVTGLGAREVGWLTATDDESQLDLLVAHHDGQADKFVGQAAAITRWEFAGATGSRLYGITPDGRLAYVDERLADDATEPVPYASAVLDRVAG